MKYDDIHPALRLFLGTREALRRLGFSADDLYCQLSLSLRNNGVLSCFCMLKAQGKTFSVECGPIEDQDAFVVEFQKVAAEFNAGTWSEEDRQRLIHECPVFTNATSFVAALVSKGFKIPKTLS